MQQFIYDPWGKQYSVSTSSLFTTYSNPGDSKGYTGHKMINDFDVIHMGGRTYNPILGRFMQADPFIQAPSNLQNYNRYSYVLNNPMSYTDPSGYIFNKLFKGINKALGKFAPVFGIALMFFIPGAQAWAAQSIFHAAASGFVVGGVSTGSLRGAVVGAITGAAFYQVGSHFGDKFKGQGFGDLSLGQQAQWAGGHAAVGGISSSLSGGKFGHGFFSAGFTKFAMGNAGFDYSNRGADAIAARTAIAAIIGGTASVISGGKFANGARTAALAHLLNAEKQASRSYSSRTVDGNVYHIPTVGACASGPMQATCIAAGANLDKNSEAYKAYALAKGIDVAGDVATGALTVASGGAPVATLLGRAGLATAFSRLGLGAGSGNLAIAFATDQATGADFAGTASQYAFYYVGRTVTPMLPVQHRIPFALGLEGVSQSTGYLYSEASKNARGK